MIYVTITPASLSVKGHAGYNPGNDIVCAAVSALVQAFEASAKEFTTDEIKSSLRDGDAVISWPRAPTAELSLLIDSLYLGLCMMAESFPENITVTGTR
ncbi:MAG: ribosomal-processing cysteine protease Prp [Sarcina sp.]|nr:ribosomal-processing cysteine protease Prp [Sarcina sp.]